MLASWRINATVLSVGFLLLSAAVAQQPFVHGNDIRFSIRTDRRAYNIGDQVVIHYTIKNVSNGALYVPAVNGHQKTYFSGHRPTGSLRPGVV